MLSFMPCGTMLFLYVSGDVAHGETSDRVMESRASDVTYSHRVRGDIVIDNNLINRCLISAVHLRVITVEIECARWTHGFIVII